MPFFLCWFCLVSQAVPIPVLYLYLLVFLHCLSLFGWCWTMYKELWQRAATALTLACLPSYSLSIAEPQTHAHVWKTHTAQLLYESPTLVVVCMSNKQNNFPTFPCCLSSSMPFFFLSLWLQLSCLLSRQTSQWKQKGFVCTSPSCLLL